VRLAYAATGSGPPLVKAANWLSHIEHDWQSPIWRHWIDGLSRCHTYIRYDTRGCGLSDREPPEISLEAWVRDLEAVVDAAGLERFPLLGISQGGPVAVSYAVRHPERVSHLVLYGAFPRGRLRRGLGQAAVEEVLLMNRIIELYWGTSNAAFRKVFANQFMPGAPAELMDAFDELQRQSASSADARRALETSAQVDVTDLAPRVACPTLVMHGRQDGRVAFDQGEVFASLIPGARFVPLESRNHILMAGEPAWARFLAEIEAFLPRGGAEPAFAALTARERDVLEQLARGLDNHQIAARLELSEKTVRNHVSSVLAKLAVESRAQAIVRAREAGFGVAAAAR
jgi:pimeloyl-ACP methyl ester carboxylesterase/DNA-binding CsgD family transcriptional regulator